MKRGRHTGGRTNRTPRRAATLRIEYRKDSSTNYYTATDPVPEDAALPDRVYLTEAFRERIRKNCDRMLSRTSSKGMLTGLRRKRPRKGAAPGVEYLSGNIPVTQPGTGRREYRDLDATLSGDLLTLTLY